MAAPDDEGFVTFLEEQSLDNAGLFHRRGRRKAVAKFRIDDDVGKVPRGGCSRRLQRGGIHG
jgi:hypothetical protein